MTLLRRLVLSIYTDPWGFAAFVAIVASIIWPSWSTGFLAGAATWWVLEEYLRRQDERETDEADWVDDDRAIGGGG